MPFSFYLQGGRDHPLHTEWNAVHFADVDKKACVQHWVEWWAMFLSVTQSRWL